MDSLACKLSNTNMMKLTPFSWLLLSFCLVHFLNFTKANEADNLYRLLKSGRSQKQPPLAHSWAEFEPTKEHSPAYIGGQDGLMQADKIGELPGQPDGVDFEQYAGYVTVDPQAGRALFYYFVESPHNSSTNPLVLWLNGGPGCSSFGFGAMVELGPFRINSDGKTLFRNPYAWNNVANVIFLESPAGVGFSYSNTSSDYEITGDKSTADDAYTFLANWLERFPQYKSRDFFIAGESYAGHYVPQLAYTILLRSNITLINLKGIAIGNAWIDNETNDKGIFDYLWAHALISDDNIRAIRMYCDFGNQSNNSSFEDACDGAIEEALTQLFHIDAYNIYAPLCYNPTLKSGPPGSVNNFDPCYEWHVESYLNILEVQTALHANSMTWTSCRSYNWTDRPSSILPIIKYLMASGTRVLIYSGDIDARVPVTSSRYSINSLNLPILTVWRPWYTNNQVGGYVEEYKGATLVTVRGAGHLVPSYQPERALTMITSFLQGSLPPLSP